MIWCVEVLAIYESPGVNPTGQRTNQRNSDFALAQTRAAQVGHAVDPQANEYMETFGPGDGMTRYGFGWRARQWVSVRQDADDIGAALWTRLSGRNLRDGTKVLVFPRDETVEGYSTGDVVFARYLPAGVQDIG